LLVKAITYSNVLIFHAVSCDCELTEKYNKPSVEMESFEFNLEVA